MRTPSRRPVRSVPGLAALAALATALAVALVLLAGCGSDDDDDGGASPPSQADLDGTTYTSTAVIGHGLVDGSSVRVLFESGTMAVEAGCNTQTGDYEVSDGTLRWSRPARATGTACATSDLADQDQWLAELFSDGLDARLEGGRLTLTDGDVELALSSG